MFLWYEQQTEGWANFFVCNVKYDAEQHGTDLSFTEPPYIA